MEEFVRKTDKSTENLENNFFDDKGNLVFLDTEESTDAYYLDKKLKPIKINQQSDWNETNEESPSFIQNKPTDIFVNIGYSKVNNNVTKISLENLKIGKEYYIEFWDNGGIFKTLTFMATGDIYTIDKTILDVVSNNYQKMSRILIRENGKIIYTENFKVISSGSTVYT